VHVRKKSVFVCWSVFANVRANALVYVCIVGVWCVCVCVCVLRRKARERIESGGHP